jgi:hypothetical protein
MPGVEIECALVGRSKIAARYTPFCEPPFTCLPVAEREAFRHRQVEEPMR